MAPSLPNLSKPKFFAIPTSPALLLVISFPSGYLHYLWSRIFYAGATFFMGVCWGFSGSPTWGSLLIFFSQSMQAAPAAIISCNARGLPPWFLGPG